MIIREQIESDLKDIYNKYLHQIQNENIHGVIRSHIINHFKYTYEYDIDINITFINNTLNIDLLNTEDFFNTYRRRKIEKIKRNIWSKKYGR